MAIWERIVDKSTELGIEDSKEFRDFGVAYGLNSEYDNDTKFSIYEDKLQEKDIYTQKNADILLKEVT